jgi:hypothetical protein
MRLKGAKPKIDVNIANLKLESLSSTEEAYYKFIRTGDSKKGEHVQFGVEKSQK